MKETTEQLEYRQKYAHLPSERDKLLDYMKDHYKLNMDEIYAEEDRIKNIPWNRIDMTYYGVPKGTPRPRYSSNTGTFYVKGAKKMHQAFKELVDDHKLICTRIDYTLTVYIPTPTSSMSKKEVYLAEEGLILPTVTPDWDNLAKTYTDCLQGVLLLNDNIINPGKVYKYYSLKPRVEITILYQNDYDSNYNRRRIEQSTTYKKYIEDNGTYQDGLITLN